MKVIATLHFFLFFLVVEDAIAFCPAKNGALKSALCLRTSSALFAAPVGPVARAKKLMDPEEYDRVVKERMKQSKMTRQEAEDDYNNFLENPPFYYALEKKVSFLIFSVYTYRALYLISF